MIITWYVARVSSSSSYRLPIPFLLQLIFCVRIIRDNSPIYFSRPPVYAVENNQTVY